MKIASEEAKLGSRRLSDAVWAVTTAFFLISGSANAGVIDVPGDYTTIQTAIGASTDGDTVMVSPGVYVENINLMGKAIYLLAEDSGEDRTVIDGRNAPHPDSASTVLVVSGEGRDTVIEGFTIRGGEGTISPLMYEGNKFGGGVFIQFSSPTIRNNVIKQNSAFLAAGLLANISSALIENNVVKNNSAGRAAGGIGVASQGGELDSVPRVVGNLIFGNTAVDHAGGVEIGHGAEAVFSHNIVAYNSAKSAGGVFLLGVNDRMVCSNNIIVYNTSLRYTGSGLRIGVYGSPPLITGNIVAYNDSAGGIFVIEYPVQPLLTYNVVWGNTTENFVGTDPSVGDTTWGVNVNGVPSDCFFNIVREPMLAGELPWQYSLSYGSPCIDAGNPVLPVDPDGTTSDAGARYFSQLDSVTVTVNPHGSVVEPGGILDFDLAIGNPGNGTFKGQVWTEVVLPDSTRVSPLLGPKTIEYAPGDSTTRVIPQKIPHSAPVGSTYIYIVRLGFFPDVTVASDSFLFSVLE